MISNQTTTRKQLQGYGATPYQARALTQSLSRISTEQSRSYSYFISDVITSIRQYLQRPRIQKTTHQKLEFILEALLERLGNVIEISVGRSNDTEISKLARNVMKAMAQTDQTLVELKATAATIKGKYGIEVNPE